MTGSASDPMLSATSPAPSASSTSLSVTRPSSIATSSASSHHRILSQLPSKDVANLTRDSKQRSKRKSLLERLERLTGSRKSINKSGKTWKISFSCDWSLSVAIMCDVMRGIVPIVEKINFLYKCLSKSFLEFLFITKSIRIWVSIYNQSREIIVILIEGWCRSCLL